MRTTLRYLAPLIAAGGLAAALAAASPAAAEPAPAPAPNPTLPQCVDTGGAQAIGGSTTECATPGNVSIDATPAQQEYVGPWGSMWEGDGFFFP
ncbi:hypothetical protein [Mycobacterium lehmannii]|uniref:hypothetical protein n=1 Tax=Mycobacterium lehmannii TaxID=2048550 RepID=UPI000B93C7E3|nr:hypothetical protein [Mycobacterium lehmannii]